jgi:hypothetical protein
VPQYPLQETRLCGEQLCGLGWKNLWIKFTVAVERCVFVSLRVCLSVSCLFVWSVSVLEKKWQSVESFQVHHLLKVLSKKRDPVTHVCFMQEVLKENKKSGILMFWESITITLREEFTGAAQSKDSMKESENKLPKSLFSGDQKLCLQSQYFIFQSRHF